MTFDVQEGTCRLTHSMFLAIFTPLIRLPLVVQYGMVVKASVVAIGMF